MTSSERHALAIKVFDLMYASTLQIAEFMKHKIPPEEHGPIMAIARAMHNGATRQAFVPVRPVPDQLGKDLL